MTRIKDITSLSTLFEKNKPTVRVNKPIQSKLFIVTIAKNADIQDGLRTLSNELQDSDAMIAQGIYGSALWGISDTFRGILEEHRQVLPYDYYRLLDFIRKDFVPNSSVFLSRVVPSVTSLGEAILASSFGVGVGMAVIPTISDTNRKWFVQHTPYRSRTAIFVLTGDYGCMKNHSENPMYNESGKSYEQYLYDNYKNVFLPSFHEGFDNIVIVLDESEGPVHLNGAPVGVSSVKNYYGNQCVTKLIEVK